MSPNASQVQDVAGWLGGSNLEQASQELAAREAELEAAKKRVSAAKKAVARAILD